MQRDLRDTPLYREAEALHRALRSPGSGRISDAAEVHVSSDGRRALFAGTLVDVLEGSPPTRICEIDLASGETRVLTFGPNTDRLPRYSRSGNGIAFLSDRHETGDFQLYLLDVASGAARCAPRVDGWIEYLEWSPDGRRVLLGVAGHGADLAGGQISKRATAEPLPSWMPEVATGNEHFRWRHVWVYELATDTVRRISPAEANIWEAGWCGNDALAAVTSPGPAEGLWYSAHLETIELATGQRKEIYTPRYQLGLPAGSADGRYVAVVEAVCSDRGYVAGDLHLIDLPSGRRRSVEVHGIDVTYLEWCSERQLLVAGHRGHATVVSLCEASSGDIREIWSSDHVTTFGRYVTVSGFGDAGNCVLVGEGFLRAPEIAVIHQGTYRTVRSLAPAQTIESGIAAIERLSWRAPDGLEIQGWLLRPRGEAPHPLVTIIHGGPVWHWRPLWFGRWGAAMAMLMKRGYAVFLPNPRGSSGRGQEFARQVVGEMGGADTYDFLSGLDHLVERGLADPGLLGVVGGSYGGFMTAWLVTQDSRFAAAVAVAPSTNQVTSHLLSNIPHFVSMFLADTYTNPGGKYFQRSPIMHAHRVKTPTLNICGALDRCTPPEEAVQFHNALLENGVRSVLVRYPEEGHGVRKLPATIDYAARVVGWFEQHMPPRASVT